jgi:hypothetical protein
MLFYAILKEIQWVYSVGVVVPQFLEVEGTH